MITTRYIDVAFGGARSAMARALYQYDYGQILRITDLALPFAYEVHFSDTKTGNSVTMIGNADGVEIPDACLLTSGNVYCWFYLHDTESDGETRYEVLIPILARAKPTNASPTPVQQDVIDQAIAALDAAVQQTGEDVIAAGASASAAAGSASDAEAWAVGERDGEPVESSDPAYHNNSKYYAGEAASAAQTASQDAQTASDAAIAAGNAKTAAETAQGKAETAQEKAEAAQTAAEDAADQTALDVIAAADSADEASGYANTASGYASTASGYAIAAQGHANDASGYALSASGYATNAYNSAQAAAGSAGEASGYASSASGYASAANDAKLAAQGAQTAAETAQGLAEAAQTGAEAAQTAAETARDTAIAATEDKAPVILDSASGSIVSIVDGAGGMNARSLVAAFSPIQSGSGVPSPDNVRPISGRTGVTAFRAGKNLLDESSCVAGNFTTAPSTYPNGNVVSDYISVVAGQKYTLSQTNYPDGSFGRYIRLYDASKTQVGSNITTYTKSPYILTVPSGVSFIRLMWYSAPTYQTVNDFLAQKAIFEVGETASAYTPFVSRTSYPVSWQSEAGTVYGGTVDIVSGVLMVTHGEIASYNGETLPAAWISDRDVYDAETTPSIGAQVVYELATPQTYQLDPQTVSMLLGANNVWATGDTVDLTYPCDTKLFIMRMLG